MEYQFQLKKNTVQLLKNNRFANAYSYTAEMWEAIIWTNGLNQAGQAPSGLTVHLYLSEYYTLENITGVAVDVVNRRGVYNDSAVKVAQGGINGDSGIWVRQNNVVVNGNQYNCAWKILYFYDESLALGLPPGSGFVELRLGDSGAGDQRNTTGTFGPTLTASGDASVYIIMYACRAVIEYVEVNDVVSPIFVIVPDPINFLEDLEITIEPDEVLGGVFRHYIAEAIFDKEGYQLIKEVFDDYGEDGSVLCDIYSRCSEFDSYAIEFEGIIFFDDLDLDVYKCEASVTIEQNDSFGKIIRNKLAEFNVYDGHSISGNYVGQSPLHLVQYKDVVGVTIKFAYTFYVHDLLRQFVLFVCDGELDFQADCLGGSAQGYGVDGEYSAMIIATGYELRNNSPQGLKETYTTFYKVWKSISAAFGVYATIEDVSGTLTFIVKKYSDNYDPTVTVQYDYVDNIVKQVDKDIRYKSINVGFKEFEDQSASDGEAFAEMLLRFNNDNSTGSSKDLTSDIIASNNLHLIKFAQSGSDALVFEYDQSLFFSQLTAHAVYNTLPVDPSVPYNIGGATPLNNNLVYPWNMYSRHRRYIYASSALSKFTGNLIGTLAVQGSYNDFRSNGTNQYVTWIKVNPGSPASDLYLKFIYKFDQYLTLADIAAIIANQEQMIGVSDSNSGHKYGWIKSIKMRLVDQLTTIIIFGED